MPVPDRSGAVAKAALVVGGLFAMFLAGVAVGRLAEPTPSPIPAPPPKPVPAEPPPPAAPEPAAPTTLGRGDLVEAARLAAAAYADARAAPAELDELVGRSFEVQLPLGCGSPPAAETNRTAARTPELGAEHPTAESQPGQSLRWSLAVDGSSLRLSAAPAIFSGWALLGSAVPDAEAAEGFWLQRPWAESEGCPPSGPETSPPDTPTHQTVGLVQFFVEGESRVLQRGTRPYQFVWKLPSPEAARQPREVLLRLSGRIKSYQNGRPVHCVSRRMDEPPACLFSVEYSKVAFVDPASGEILAEWTR